MPQATPHAPPSLQAAREIRRDTPLRRARSCYGHLAGVAGVTLMDSLLSHAWLEESGIVKGRLTYRLTPSGQSALTQLGLALPAPSRTRRYAYGCVDWTERRYHLAGALGVALLESLFANGIITRLPDPDAKSPSCRNRLRVISLQRPLESWLEASG